MVMPKNIGPVHFVGIGGIGMSGIAEMLAGLDTKVQGSDRADGANVQRLRKLGIPVEVGHTAANLGDARVVVISSAIKDDNPEVMAARERKIPVVKRADMLAELMRFKSCVAVAGTHGKTTTTTMVSALLDAGGLDPTVINGGVIAAYGSNARQGSGDWMVVEADESDGSFLRLPAEAAVITNIDPEHLDYYVTFDAAKKAFRSFVEQLPFYGFAVACLDHSEVQRLIATVTDRRIIPYGQSPQAEVRYSNVRSEGATTVFDVAIRPRRGAPVDMPDLRLPMPGLHNVSNATAAIAVAHRLGVSPEAIREGLASFGGVHRRFTHTGDWRGVAIYDDYAHHPVEIRAVLGATRAAAADGKVIAIMQPHRYTRLRDLFDEFASCFNDADTVVIAPVYEAGEQPIENVNAHSLARRIADAGHRDVRTIEDPSEIARLVSGTAKAGDYVVFCGAGNISSWAHALPRELADLEREEAAE